MNPGQNYKQSPLKYEAWMIIYQHYYLIMCLWVLRSTTKGLSQDSQPISQDLNMRSSEYKTGLLTTMP